MFSDKITAAVLLAAGLALGLSSGAGLAATGTHEGHATGHLSLSLNAGEKWQGDDNMHKGMEGIRAAITARSGEIHENTLAADQYRSLAAEILTQTDFMIENCDLEPAADEQLHIVLGQVIEGASEMENGSEPRAGAIMVVQALDAYAKHFEHPGWRPLD